jgi:hypothetical protein
MGMKQPGAVVGLGGDQLMVGRQIVQRQLMDIAAPAIPFAQPGPLTLPAA